MLVSKLALGSISRFLMHWHALHIFLEEYHLTGYMLCLLQVQTATSTSMGLGLPCGKSRAHLCASNLDTNTWVNPRSRTLVRNSKSTSCPGSCEGYQLSFGVWHGLTGANLRTNLALSRQWPCHTGQTRVFGLQEVETTIMAA